jgi:hypothetical protein
MFISAYSRAALEESAASQYNWVDKQKITNDIKKIRIIPALESIVQRRPF